MDVVLQDDDDGDDTAAGGEFATQVGSGVLAYWLCSVILIVVQCLLTVILYLPTLSARLLCVKIGQVACVQIEHQSAHMHC